MNEITITRPDDMHLHIREGQIMQTVIQHTSKQFARAIIRPNLDTPIIDAELAYDYFMDIKKAVPDFEPLMTIYFRNNIYRFF